MMTPNDSKTPPEAEQVGATACPSVDLPVRKLDLKEAAAKLRIRVDELNKSIADLDEAKTVNQQLLDREVSI